MLREPSLKGGTLGKDTPYPIFLPVVVQTMLDVYAFFSGAERMKRLGADVSHGSRDPWNDQHGDWGLIPASVGLVVIRVAQHVAWDEHHVDREVFSRFKATRPPAYATSWMYGGQTLLFYRADKDHPADGETVIDGLECKVWYAGRLGMHPRDLYGLADALRARDDFPVLQWTNSSGDYEPRNARNRGGQLDSNNQTSHNHGAVQSTDACAEGAAEDQNSLDSMQVGMWGKIT